MDANKAKRIKTILGLCLAGVIVVLLLSGGRKGIQVGVQNQVLHLAYSDQQSWDIPYENITAMELVQSLDRGSFVSGVESRGQSFGMWENQSFGVYRLCAFADIDRTILLHLPEGVVAFNYESDDATEKLYQALEKAVFAAG